MIPPHLISCHLTPSSFLARAKVDVKFLKQNAEYEDIDSSSAVVQSLWQVLEEMNDEERTSFLRFVSARSRTSHTHSIALQIKGVHYETPDDYLPHAQTCFFSLSLPNYSSTEILKVSD